VARHFLDERRIEVGVLLIGHEERDLQPPRQPPVHQRHLEFEFEVADRAQSADHHQSAHTLAERHREVREVHDVDLPHAFDDGLDHRHPLFDREQRRLPGIDRDRHDHPVEQAHGAAGEIEMTVGEGVERSGEQRDALAFHRSS
jgi:hypothetical protein